MSNKHRLKTIQDDIKTIQKCIDMCIDEDGVEYLMLIQDHMYKIEKELKKCIDMCIDEDGVKYLKSIQKHMRKQEIKLIKQIAFKKALKEHQK